MMGDARAMPGRFLRVLSMGVSLPGNRTGNGRNGLLAVRRTVVRYGSSKLRWRQASDALGCRCRPVSNAVGDGCSYAADTTLSLATMRTSSFSKVGLSGMFL